MGARLKPPLTRRAASQDCDLGYASAAVSAQLEPSRLLARVGGVGDGVQRVCDALLARRTSAAGVVAAGGSGAARAVATFASLPRAVELLILFEIPADERARLALVCRAWRDMVADPEAWKCLDLSVRTSGITVAVTDATLRAAAARANGRLYALHLDDCTALTQAARLEVVTANADTLRVLSVWCSEYSVDLPLALPELEALALAAPLLEEFHADAKASVEQVIRLPRNEAPVEALKLRSLLLDFPEEAVDEAAVLDLAAALQGYGGSLKVLELQGLPLDAPAALDAICTAATAQKLASMSFERCRLGPASIPALVRLISGGALEFFKVSNGDVPLLDEAAGVQLAGALATSSVEHVVLYHVDLWRNGAAKAVLRALEGHPTLRELELCGDHPAGRARAGRAGRALGALVAADAPSLTCLRLANSALVDDGLEPIVDALRRNTHLRELDCYNLGMSRQFARKRFLPAVRKNGSLRKLCASAVWGTDEDGVAPPAVLEAEALVAARPAADEAAAA